jgi:hypothetical protein
MEKSLCFGETDRIKTFLRSKKRGAALYMRMRMVKKGIEKGTIKNWGDLFVNTMDTQSFRGLR